MQAINVALQPPPSWLCSSERPGRRSLDSLSVFAWGEPFALDPLAGGLLYLVCAILPTAVYHVPRN